jgi:hypothetical protein
MQFRGLGMVKIILDAAMIEKLRGLTAPLQLCDEAGHTLARVLPEGYDPKLLEPQISDEELERRFASDERRYTTAEVIAHLKSL